MDVKVFSEKAGKTVSVKVTSKPQTAYGWMDSGWSKSGGWFRPSAN